MIRLTPEQLAAMPPDALGPTTADGFAKLRQCFSEPVQEPAREEDFLADVIAFAKRLGYRHYHTRDSRKSVAGFPDLCLVGRGRLIFAELKIGDNTPTAEQSNWLDDLRAAGVPAYCWWPKDWGQIREVLG